MNDAPGEHRPIHIGISSCLLGEPVRFDGGHKRDPFLTETFGAFVAWVPVCPRWNAGLARLAKACRIWPGSSTWHRTPKELMLRNHV